MSRCRRAKTLSTRGWPEGWRTRLGTHRINREMPGSVTTNNTQTHEETAHEHYYQHHRHRRHGRGNW
jgi:hypothetical protein